jgi:WD domain, G-beta repeat
VLAFTIFLQAIYNAIHILNIHKKFMNSHILALIRSCFFVAFLLFTVHHQVQSSILSVVLPYGVRHSPDKDYNNKKTTMAEDHIVVSPAAASSRSQRRVLDPILSLPIPSPASSLCFVSPSRNVNTFDSNSNADHVDDDDDDEIMFRSSALLSQNKQHSTTLSVSEAACSTLDGRFLVTCHHDGTALLWDLKIQKQSSIPLAPSSSSSSTSSRTNTNPSSAYRRDGAGLAVRRTEDPSRFLYQTRDERGTVSLHECERLEAVGKAGATSNTSSSIIRQYDTFSSGFCQMAPCCGNQHLLALPYESPTRSNNDKTSIMVVDHRAKDPVANIFISNGNKHGLITSLGFSMGGGVKSKQPTEDDQKKDIPSSDGGGSYGSDRPIVACGMESGTAFFYDLSMPSQCINVDGVSDISTQHQQSSLPYSTCSLGKEPILTMDLIPSTPVSSSSRKTLLATEGSPVVSQPSFHASSVLVVAGLAGDAAELERLSKDEAGRVVLFKATTTKFGDILNQQDNSPDATTNSARFQFQHRARLSTLKIENDDNGPEARSSNVSVGVSAGKPGVSICRFRPRDGRLFAVGGWDRRVRLFDRSDGKRMAILKGHAGSVSAFDWSHDADSSGLLASSGSGTKIINVWQCFATK